jgi:TolB protein
MPIVHTYPSWSPDGKRLAISAGLPGHLQLYTTLVDGPGQLSPVTQSAVSDVEASWSPSGGELVFARTSTPAQSDLVIVNLATHGERVLHVERNARQPAWSPNGDLIAFSGRNPGGPTDIYTVSVQSGVVRQMTASAVADRHPSWARQLR